MAAAPRRKKARSRLYLEPLEHRWVPSVTLLNSINHATGDASPAALLNDNGTLYFSATDGIHGRQLWTSDGTVAGTVMVTDVNPTNGGIDPQQLVNVNGKVFFTADDGTDGRQVWESDGTTTGTVMVSAIPVSKTGPNIAELTSQRPPLLHGG